MYLENIYSIHVWKGFSIKRPAMVLLLLDFIETEFKLFGFWFILHQICVLFILLVYLGNI